MKKIVLVGAGGHCKVIIEIIRSTNQYEIIGITDTNKQTGEYILDVPILGNDEYLKVLFNKGIECAFLCVGALSNPNIRNKMYSMIKDIGFQIPILIHQTAIISQSAKIGFGTCIMAGVIIEADTTIGENCIINSGAIVEHDCKIGMNTHISPGACIAGTVNIGYNCHVGINSTIIQGIRVFNNVTIGGGAVVINDIEDNLVVVGVPAKSINRR